VYMDTRRFAEYNYRFQKFNQHTLTRNDQGYLECQMLLDRDNMTRKRPLLISVKCNILSDRRRGWSYDLSSKNPFASRKKVNLCYFQAISVAVTFIALGAHSNPNEKVTMLKS
jgi:hypothetical protein